MTKREVVLDWLLTLAVIVPSGLGFAVGLYTSRWPSPSMKLVVALGWACLALGLVYQTARRIRRRRALANSGMS